MLARWSIVAGVEVAVAAVVVVVRLLLLEVLEEVGAGAVGRLQLLVRPPLRLLLLTIVPRRASRKHSAAAVRCRARTQSRTRLLCTAPRSTGSISSSSFWSRTAPT